MISALSSDAIPNCPTYTSPTPSGGTQSVSFLATVPLAGVGDQSFAGLSQMQSGGRTVYAAELAIRRGSLLSVVNIFSPDPINVAFATAVARLDAEHLASVSPGP